MKDQEKKEKLSWPNYEYMDNPKHWDANGRIVLTTYDNTADIMIYEGINFLHRVTITVKDGKLRTRVTQQVENAEIEKD